MGHPSFWGWSRVGHPPVGRHGSVGIQTWITCPCHRIPGDLRSSQKNMEESEGMKQIARMYSSNVGGRILSFCAFAAFSSITSLAQATSLCLDGFCIGQSIRDARFDKAAWTVPKDLLKERCTGVGCRPENAFRGYAPDDQVKLAEAVNGSYGLNAYNVITKDTLETLRGYKYECNTSARKLGGERRFIGVYRSIPSQYLTVVGLRLINSQLTVYRIARQYPYHNQNELTSLAKELGGQYGQRVLLYDYLSSNAYSTVIEQHRDGWLGRSTMFNPSDLSDNAAELVLIDPNTRSLLEPSSMPESGEISPLPVALPPACNRSLPIQ
jgi:hypothetical protein